jgi:hypothetical protein
VKPCASPAPACSAPVLRTQTPRPRRLTGPENAAAARQAIAALKTMGEHVPRPVEPMALDLWSLPASGPRPIGGM